MDPYRNNQQQAMYEKISSSIKKSHKISIYSRRTNNNTNKSPKKQQNDANSLQQQNMNNTQQFNREISSLSFSNNNQQHSVQLNSAKINYQKGGNNNSNIINEEVQIQQQRSLSQYNNNIPLLKQQPQSYKQKQIENDFFNEPNTINRKIHTFTTTYVNNISQMIDKQAQSQVNNLSILEGSFMTGNRNKANNIKQSQHSFSNDNKNIILTNNNLYLQQQQTMGNFMKLLHEQISIVKQNYEQKFNQILKSNTHTIKQLQSRLYQNHLKLNQKILEIDRLKQMVRKLNNSYNSIHNHTQNKRFHSQGEITGKEQKSPTISKGSQPKTINDTQNNNINNNNAYYQKRISDLQAKIRVLQSIISTNPQQQTSNKLQKKMQLLEKGLINYFSSKLHNISTSLLQPLISSSSNKLSTLYQSIQSLTLSLSNFKEQAIKIGFNQNRIKQLATKIKQIDKELRQFQQKQFKYQNYEVYQLKEIMKTMNQKIKGFQQNQSENGRLLKQFVQQIVRKEKQENSKFSLKKQPTINLNNAHETISKYTQSIINNTSRNSISQLSNTHQYSHLMQKLNPSQNNPNTFDINQQFNLNNRNNNNNNGTSSQSFIQLNFTLQQGQQQLYQGQVMGLVQSKKGDKFNDKKRIINTEKNRNSMENGVTAMSKYTMVKSQTNKNNYYYKQQQQTTTNTYNKNTKNASLISKLSLPNTRPSISIQSILSPPHLSSTQQKIRNLSQLKMQSKQRLQSKERLSSISSLSQQQYFEQQQQTQKPRSPLQKKQQKPYNRYKDSQIPSSSYIDNNTSYFSIGQLQDYHQSVEYQHLLQLQGNNKNNTSCDWSDDQFFYPQLMQKQYQQQSNVQAYCWDKTQPISSKQNLQSPPNKNKKQNYTLPKAKPNNNSYSNNSKNKFDSQNQQFSPMKKKLISTQTNFYQSMKYDNKNNNTQQQSPRYQKLTKTNSIQYSQYPQKKLIYSGNFDYQKFSDSQEEKETHYDKNSPLRVPMEKNDFLLSNNKFPPKKQQIFFKNQQTQSSTQQSYTVNEQKLIEKIKLLQRSQLPIKFIYDRKKCQGIAKMPNPGHQLNGKSFLLQRRQLEKLQTLGLIQVKTYI